LWRFAFDARWIEIDARAGIKKLKHSIDVVVDASGRSGAGNSASPNRSTDSAAHADGPRAGAGTGRGREHVFSSKFSWPICGYSIAELEPRLFSFNNPGWAPADLRRLGAIQFFDPSGWWLFPHCVPGVRRDQGLGPAQPSLLPDAAVAGVVLRSSTRTCRSKSCRQNGRT